MEIAFTGHVYRKSMEQCSRGKLDGGAYENLPSQEIHDAGPHAPVYITGVVWCFETARSIK